MCLVSACSGLIRSNYFFRAAITQGMNGPRRASSSLRLGTLAAVCAFASCTTYHAIPRDGASDASPSEQGATGTGGSATGTDGSAVGTGGAPVGTVGTGGSGSGGAGAGGNGVGTGGQGGTVFDAGTDSAGDGRDGSDAAMCDAIGCQSTCSTTAGCAAGNYCSGSSCVPQKSVGAACGAGQECASAICGGRCCTTACTCPLPSSANLFGASAGFDTTDLTGWGQTSSFQWSSDDADGCPYSGSIRILAASGNPRRCLTVTPGAFYEIGGTFKNTDGTLWGCSFFTFSSPNCPVSEPTGASGTFSGTNTNWVFQSMIFQVPVGNVSLIFYCDSNSNSLVDKLFLSMNGGF